MRRKSQCEKHWRLFPAGPLRWPARRGRLAALTTALVVALPCLALTQRGGSGRFAMPALAPSASEAVPYDGRLTFTRIRYGGGFGFRGSAWNHDYPDADRNLPLILREVTATPVHVDRSNVLDLEDPAIFRQPILYVWEPGYWTITDAGAKNLRDYMLKGGFVIFDDFEADQWINFEAQFRRALPDAVFQRIDATHPIFHAFFDIDRLELPHPSVNVVPAYYAVFENNDPTRRMLALANHNSDIAEYWEWSGRGLFPFDMTNDAYKYGVNYFIYGLSH